MSSLSELKEVKKTIEEEAERSHKRPHNDYEKLTNKEYDYRRGLQYAMRQIEGMLGPGK